MENHDGRHRVVIVGGGFAGLFAARTLRREPVSVTLVDMAPNHVFQPLLYQCATGILSEGKVAFPLRSLLSRHRNVETELAQVTGFDVDARVVRAVRPNGEPLDLPYDDLIVAAGVQQSYFGHDEFAEHAPGMKTIADALAIRRRVFGAFELAESSSDPAERAAWLTFALVGAGPTGVELAGQIRELATKTLRREYRHIEPQDARVLLFDGGTAPLAAFGPKLSARAARALAGLGVEQRMQSVVTDIGHGWLEVRDRDGKQSRYQAGTVLWTAGVAAPPVARALADATGAQTDKAGRVAGNRGSDHRRPPGDLGGGRHDEPARLAGSRRGGHAERAVRRAPDPAPGRGRACGQAVPLSRSGLGRLHRPRQRRACRPDRCTSAASSGGSAGC